MKKAFIILVVLVCLAGSASAAFLSPTPGGRTTGTQIGGGQNAPLLPMDAWGWYEDADLSNWRGEFGTEILVPKFKIKYKNGCEQESKNLVHALPFGSLAYRVNDKLALKVNLDNPFRLGAAFEKNREQLGFDTQSLISLTTITALADIKVSDRLHLSFGPVIGYCQEKYRAPFDFNRRPIPLLTDSQADGLSDLGFAVGVFAEVTDRIKIGFQYVSEIEVDLSGRTEIYLGPLTYRDRFKSHLTFPQTFTVAGSFRVTEKLQLVGDIYHWSYSKTANDQKLDFQKLPLVKGLAIGAQDATGVHFGGNLKINDRWTVRAGIGWLSQSVPDKRLDTLTFDVPGYDVALGASYCLNENISLSASWTHAWGESKSHNGDKLSTEIETFGISGLIKW